MLRKHQYFQFRANFEKVFYTPKSFVLFYWVESVGSMKKSLIYLVVTLTLVSLALTCIPHVASQTDQTQNVKIVSYSAYFDSLGEFNVVGEVQNTGSSILNQIGLAASVVGSDGSSLAQTTTQVYGGYLVPGEKAPFLLELYETSTGTTLSSVSISKVDIEVISATTVTSVEYENLKITGVSSYIDSSSSEEGAYWVKGSIQNTGNQNAEGLILFGTFYNSSGTVIGVGYTDDTTLTPTALTPSETATFRVAPYDINVTADPPARQVASYSLLLQSTGPLSNNATTLPDPSVYETGVSSSQPTQTSPTTATGSGSSSNYQWLIYVGIIIVIIIAVIAVVRSFPHRKLPQDKAKRKQALAKKAPPKKTSNASQFALAVFL
jgi:flagellar basal body-associated protein FliL